MYFPPHPELELNDYPLVVKHPMNLLKVQDKLKSREYRSVEEVLDHIQLVWDNCKAYNPEGPFFVLADKMERAFKKMIRNYLPSIQVIVPSTSPRTQSPPTPRPSTRPTRPRSPRTTPPSLSPVPPHAPPPPSSARLPTKTSTPTRSRLQSTSREKTWPSRKKCRSRRRTGCTSD